MQYFFPTLPLLALIAALFLCLLPLGYTLVMTWQRKQFEAVFPDLLNLISGAVSSGDTLNNAIIFAGGLQEGFVGQAFYQMGLQMAAGQPADEVLLRACHRFPYPHFLFFTLAIRANISRGGQLKTILQTLSVVMFNGRVLEKKKASMTAESRLSAKIVGAIPLVFFVIMKVFIPEDFDFVVFNLEGRGIFYYVLGSELLGAFIIWKLMRGTVG